MAIERELQKVIATGYRSEPRSSDERSSLVSDAKTAEGAAIVHSLRFKDLANGRVILHPSTPYVYGFGVCLVFDELRSPRTGASSHSAVN